MADLDAALAASFAEVFWGPASVKGFPFLRTRDSSPPSLTLPLIGVRGVP